MAELCDGWPVPLGRAGAGRRPSADARADLPADGKTAAPRGVATAVARRGRMSHEPSSVGVVGAGPARPAAAFTPGLRRRPGPPVRRATRAGRQDADVDARGAPARRRRALLGSHTPRASRSRGRGPASMGCSCARRGAMRSGEGTAHGVAYGSVPSMAASRALPAALKLKPEPATSPS